jgi:hypothetical protein
MGLREPPAAAEAETLAIDPSVRNDLFFLRSVMSNPKFALVAYCVAVGFILAVVFHTPTKTLVAASAEVAAPGLQPPR